MNIPKNASNLHMPITQNVPIDLKGAKTWFKKFKLWKFGIPNEVLVEDFYQILPRNCNKFLGFTDNIDVCVFIPKTFLFNGASIPKILSSLYLPHGILYLGALIHDFCYSYGGLIVFTEESEKMTFNVVTQHDADNIFYNINEEVNHFKTATKPAYIALRKFGFITWNHCRKTQPFKTDFPELAYLLEG